MKSDENDRRTAGQCVGRTDPNTPEPERPPLDKAARARLRELCEAATRAPWRVNVVGGPDGRAIGDDWMIGSFGEAEVDGKYHTVHVTTDRVRASEHGGSDAMDDARLIVEARNALPSLLDALDAAEARAERAEEDRGKPNALDDAADEINALCGRTTPWEYAGQLVRDVRDLVEKKHTAESALATLRAEAEGMRARLARATYFSWRAGAVWIVMPEGSTRWHAYKESGSCGACLIGKFDSLDAAWAAAEAAAKKEGA